MERIEESDKECALAMAQFDRMQEKLLDEKDLLALARHLNECEACRTLFCLFQDYQMAKMEERGQKLADENPPAN